MNTRKALTAVFASLAAALVGGQFAAVALGDHSNQSTSAGIATGGNVASGGTLSAPGSTSTSQQGQSTGSQGTSTGSGLRDGTVTGQSVNTPYGSVQVKVTVASGSISDVIAVHLTDRGGYSVQVSNYAAPILRGEVLQSQSTQVSMVSGATYTSEAYLTSLQSALDQMAG